MSFSVRCIPNSNKPNALPPYSLPALLLILLPGSLSGPLSASAQSPIPQAQAIVDTLASPYFGGRGYSDNGDSLAASYIASQFEEAGLSPLLDTYFQDFSLQVAVHDSTPALVVNGQPLRLGKDFLPYDSSPGISVQNHTHIVHAGSGIILPNLGINEYAGKNTQGAIVILQDAIPDSIRSNPEVVSEYLSRTVRTEIAAQLGAKAVVFITASPLAYGGNFRPAAIPACIAHQSTWPKDVHSVGLEITSRLQVPVTTNNVIGYQQGARFPGQYIVLMGHYDHLGRLGPDHYFPGANDNASGIALMVNIASSFKDSPQSFSLVYIAFSGEEQGLIGSRYFVQHTPIPLDSIRFVINLDMVASGNGGLVALGGNESPEAYSLLKKLNDSLQLGPIRKRSNAPNSDHYFFLQQGVPGFFIYTDKGTQPYHHMEDLPETLNWEEYEDTYTLVKRFIESLSSIRMVQRG